MIQKRTRSLSVMAVVLVAVWVVLVRQNNNVPRTSSAKDIVSQGSVGATLTMPARARSAAVGWSTNDDPRRAVHEAVAMMRQRLGTKQPIFALASFTVLYDRDATIAAIRSELGPKVKIHGLTSINGLMTNEGLHVGKVVGVLGVADDGVAFGVGDIDAEKSTSLHEAGKAAILAAIADSGHKAGEKPDIIIMSASKRRGGEMEILDGIASVVGRDTPVLGGNAGDEKFDHQWTEFTQGATYHDGLVLTAVYSKRKVGWAFENGFRITDKSGIATRSDGQTLYEIDHRPALDVYNEWLNGALMDHIQTQGHFDIEAFTAQYPLCKVMRGPNGQIGYLTALPVPRQEDMAGKTLPVYARIEQGSRIQLFSGTWQTILNRAELAPANSLIRGDIPRDDAMFATTFFCAGAYFCIPKSERPKIPLLVDNAIGDTPFLGMITLGEQGYLPGVRNVSANLVVSTIAIGNK